MSPNDELSRWGEPPADETELELARLLADTIEQPVESTVGGENQPLDRQSIPGEGGRLLEASEWIESMIESVLSHSGLFGGSPLANSGGASLPTATAIGVRLLVFREVGALALQPGTAAHPRPTIVRDFRRFPIDPDRVVLRTGERVHLEIECDHDGFLIAFTVRTSGTVQLLFPESRDQAGPIRAWTPVPITDVETNLPAGRDRIYVLWTRMPFAPAQVPYLSRSGAIVGDLQFIQESLCELPAFDWQMVVAELNHAPLSETQATILKK